MSDPVTPTDTPAAQAAAGGDQPAANLRRVFAMHSASPPEDIAGGDRSPAINRVIASLGGGYCSTNLDVRDVRCLVVAFADAEGIIDALNGQLATARADLARLRAPLGDLAAIEARAADLATLRARLRAYLDDRTRSVFDIPVALIQERDEAERASAADVPALLAHIAAAEERHAAEVAAARAEALREAAAAVLARIVDHDGRNESAGVLPSVYARIIVEDCAAAVAALAAPRGR